MGFGFRWALFFDATQQTLWQVPSRLHGQNAVDNSGRKNVWPLAHRLFGAANCAGGGGDGAPQQFDGLKFLHAAI